MKRHFVRSDIEWESMIPSDWEKVYLKWLYDFEKGKNAAKYTSDYIGRNVGIYPVYSGQTEKHGIMGYINSYDYELDKCLFTTTVGARVMTPKIITGRFSLSQNCLIMRKKQSDVIDEYVYYLLITLFDYEKSLIPSHMQPSLRIEDLKRYYFYLPPLQEQQAIANFLDEKCGEIDELVALQEKMIDELKAYKQSVITETVTKGLDKNVKMKDSGVDWIGEIPEHWSTQRLRTLGWTQNGISKGGEYFGEDFEFPFVSYPDAYKNFIVPYPTGRANSSESDRETYSLIEGDVLFTRTSETIEEIGFASTCINTIPNAVYSGFLIRFRPTTNALYKGFSKYYFRGQMLRGYFVKQMNIVTRASLSQDLLKSLIVILPPLSEQHQIATYLDEKCSEIDSLISIKQKKIEELKDYKKSLIYEYVTGKKQVI